MVDNSEQEILRLFYADEPVKAFEALQLLKGKLDDKFLLSEEVQILERDFECIDEFRREQADLNKGKRDGWTVYQDMPEQKVFHKYEAGKPCTIFM